MAIYTNGMPEAWATTGGVSPVKPRFTAPALSASIIGGPDGNSAQLTSKPNGSSLFSNQPRFFSSTKAVDDFW